MQCKCGSTNINVQAVSLTRTKGHSLIYWLLVGWWLEPILFICMLIPYLIIKIFKPKKIRSKVKTYAVCQDCGRKWRV